MRKPYCPLDSLREGNWFKLICGASFQHLPAIRSLIIAYSLAGADCIDVAADRAVIRAAKDALKVASSLADAAEAKGFQWRGIPWLMVSLNDGEDPHFRKAEFDWRECVSNCSRPCEKICPAGAIAFPTSHSSFSGIIADRCYGCGRCLPVCPVQIINTRSHVTKREAIGPLLEEMGIDAIEIHTKVGNTEAFQQLWQAIAPSLDRLKLLSISCGNDPNLIDYLRGLYEIITPLPCPLIWQTDGRPMSGDLGIGTTGSTIKLAQKVLAADLPGYVQLAGGTNHHTVTKLQASGLLRESQREGKNDEYSHLKLKVAGIAYGSYARSLLAPILEQLETANQQNLKADLTYPSSIPQGSIGLENSPDLLWEATELANSLVSQLKESSKICFLHQ